jgi:O-antigen/teichoic acid export membrane protein
MKYLQVFVWWQALSGAIQVAIVMIVASTGVVRSPYALYTWSIVIHTLIQIPGFYTVTRNTLNAMQRNDYARYMDTIYAIVMPMITQPLLVPLFYWWGKNNPEIGGALGGVLGMGVAAYVLELSMFLIGLYLYKRLGYKASVIFMAHFEWSIIKETFRFGVFEMLGGMLAAGGFAAEIWITQTRLVNYTEVWGNWVLAQNFVFAFTVGTNLTDGILPAISEAVSHGRMLLSQYYSAMSYKWGAIASAFLSAVLLAVAPKFIIGSSGVEFQRAAIYVVPLVIWGSIQFATWLSDAIFLGSNRPVIRALMIFGESLLRVLLAVILLERFQIVALIIAYLAAMLTRAIVGYFIADKVCFPQSFFAWQSLVAPILATVAHYLFLSLLAQVIWQGEEISSIILFFVGILPSLPVFLFFYAFFGGWDNQTLDEFEQASELTGFLRPVLRVLFIIPSRWGARLSLLHNRFPITIRAAALEEAKSLTEEKVDLLNLDTAEEIN